MADDFPMKNTGPQLIGYVDNATDFTRLVTDAQPLPVTVASGGPSGYALEATQLLVEANTSPSAGPLAGAAVVVTTAGTRVQLTASDVPCKAVLICAKKAAGANTGNVYIGNSGVSSSNAIPWAPGSIIEWEVDNVNKLWVDAATNGDAIVYQPIARAS